jgi:hypothetical protein
VVGPLDAGRHPRNTTLACRLINEDGKPAHWVDIEDGNKVPLARAVTEWQMPVTEAVRVVTGRGYEVAAGQIS